MNGKRLMQAMCCAAWLSLLGGCSLVEKPPAPFEGLEASYPAPILGYPAEFVDQLRHYGYVPWNPSWGPVAVGDVIGLETGELQHQFRAVTCFGASIPSTTGAPFSAHSVTLSRRTLGFDLGFLGLADMDLGAYNIAGAKVTFTDLVPESTAADDVAPDKTLPSSNCRAQVGTTKVFPVLATLKGTVQVEFLTGSEVGGSASVLIPVPPEVKARLSGYSFDATSGRFQSRQPLLLGVRPSDKGVSRVFELLEAYKRQTVLSLPAGLVESLSKLTEGEENAIREHLRIVEELKDDAHAVKYNGTYMWLGNGQYFAIKQYVGRSLGKPLPLQVHDYTSGSNIDVPSRMFDVDHPGNALKAFQNTKFTEYTVHEIPVGDQFKIGLVRFTKGGLCPPGKKYDFILMGTMNRFKYLERLNVLFLVKKKPSMQSVVEGNFQIVEVTPRKTSPVLTAERASEYALENIREEYGNAALDMQFEAARKLVRDGLGEEYAKMLGSAAEYDGFKMAYKPQNPHVLALPCDQLY